MFRIEEITYLFYLGLIAVMALLSFYFITKKKKDLLKLADQGLFKSLFDGFDVKSQWLIFIWFALATALGIIALANPQWGTKMERVKAKSSDIIIAMDISQSMLAEDILPNRMERSKRFAERLVRSLKGERIGLISFAGSAYLQMPLTSDYAAAEIFAKSANPSQAGTQGTAIADAIDLAAELFEEEGPYQKALIVITDGENHDSDALLAAQKANEKGMIIYTVGVGTAEGAYIPITQNGRKGYLNDRSGNIVTSIMNREMIENLADAGKGNAYFLTQGNSIIGDIKSAISKMEKREVQQQSFTDYVSYFQYFLGVSLLIFIYLFASRHLGFLTKKDKI